MKPFFCFVALPFLFSSELCAQGVLAPWDLSRTALALAEQAERLTPVLQQLAPQQWETKGAPAAYTSQWRSTQNEVAYLANAARNLQKQPEKLTAALETYFRLQSVEVQLGSLVEGVRRYQNPAIGDLLMSILAANSGNRDQLRQYISDLASAKEQEFRIADQEAQRCRGTVPRPAASRPAAAAPKPTSQPTK